MEKSWRGGTLVTPESVHTIADGIAVRVPIPEAVGDMQGQVDEVLLVDDGDIIQALRLAYAQAGILLEPAGATGIAGVLANRDIFKDRSVATVLCGGNITAEQLRRYL